MNTFLSVTLLFSCVWLMTACINHYLIHPTNLQKRMMWFLIFPVFVLQSILGTVSFLLPEDAVAMEHFWYLSLIIYISLNCLYAFTSFLTRNKVLQIA